MSVLRTFEIPGSEPSVVLLHGLFMNHELWDPVATELGGMRLVIVDMPGHGESASTEPGATLDDHVALIADLLDSRGVKHAVVAGHSWGGMVALRLAARRPDLVAGAVFCNTPVERRSGTSRLAVHLQRAALSVIPARVYGAGAARLIIGDHFRKKHPNVVDETAQRVEKIGRWQLKELIRSVVLEPDSAFGLLEGLTIPWVAVAGEDDHEIPSHVADQLSSIGELRTAPGAHYTPQEAPELVTTAITHIRTQIPSS